MIYAICRKTKFFFDWQTFPAKCYLPICTHTPGFGDHTSGETQVKAELPQTLYPRLHISVCVPPTGHSPLEHWSSSLLTKPNAFSLNCGCLHTAAHRKTMAVEVFCWPY